MQTFHDCIPEMNLQVEDLANKTQKKVFTLFKILLHIKESVRKHHAGLQNLSEKERAGGRERETKKGRDLI